MSGFNKEQGIQERRFCHVNNSDMASVAGQHAIACAGLTPEDIDVVILATCTPDSIVPSAAAHVQRKIGAVNASVYDVMLRVLDLFMRLNKEKLLLKVDYISEHL
jgi:3-oxoacyl-[acyl-carrier-protein] synthase III